MPDPAPKQEPPRHLRTSGRKFWATVCREFDLADDQLPLLVVACECLDMAAQARRKIKREGMTTIDRFKQAKPHPCVAIHQKAVAEFRMARRELGLDVSSDNDRPRGNASPNFKA